MKLKSTILALLIGLTLISLACGNSAGNASENMSDDDKHKLFQAASITGEPTLILEAYKKMGLVDAGGKPTPAFEPFTKTHMDWAIKNAAWVQEHNDRNRAREYVKSHMP